MAIGDWTEKTSKVSKTFEVWPIDEEIEQMIDHDDKKLGVITESHLFKELSESGLPHHRPTISELLEELKKIHLEEPIEIEAPIRKDRYNSMDEIEYLKEGRLC